MTQHSTPRRALAAGVLSLALAAVGVVVADAPASATTCPSVVGGVVTPAAAPGVDWSGCNLSNAYLIGANLTGANLSGTTLTGTHLQGATLTGATISGADVAGMVLGKGATRLKSGGLIGTPATALPLAWALLNGYLVGPGSDLVGAQLQDNDFSGLDLTDADLTDANLSLATNLDSATWTGAIWTGVTCPDGSTAGQHDDGTCLSALDTTAPVATMTAPTAVFAGSTFVPFAWTTQETGSGFWQAHYRVARALATGGALSAWSTSPWSASWPMTKGMISTVAGYRYCVEVQVEDHAGNIGDWTAPRCTVIPSDDRAFTASKGWVRGKSSTWLGSTYSSTTALSASLVTAKSVAVRQFALIATQCATCGSVAIYVGNLRVATVSLRSTTVHNRGLIVLPRMSVLRGGWVKLVVTTKGKLVRIDAIGMSAA
jgi:hypothetical protein